MQKRLSPQWHHLSLEHQFLLGALLVLVCLTGLIGAWVSYEIEARVIHQTEANTALYVSSVLSPLVQDLADNDQLGPDSMTGLDSLLRQAELGKAVVALKVWGPGGRIVYSSLPEEISAVYPVAGPLARAWQGTVNSDLSDLGEEEHVAIRQFGPNLLETYSPVRLGGSGRIIAVAEFYQTADALVADLSSAKVRTWMLVCLASVISFLVLAAIVRPGSKTIARQQRQLTDRVDRLSEALADNAKLNERVQRAAVRAAAGNERSLRRISADLHDGPAQSLALALLRIDMVLMHTGQCNCGIATLPQAAKDLNLIQENLRSAMSEMRSIASGLALPELARLTVTETVERAVSEHAKRIGDDVELQFDHVPEHSSLPVKFTLYRVIQEALSNGHRHGGSTQQSIRVAMENDYLVAEVSDHGCGFDLEQEISGGEHLGLSGMRERVEAMGGTFWIDSSIENGTLVGARVPFVMSADG